MGKRGRAETAENRTCCTGAQDTARPCTFPAGADTSRLRDGTDHTGYSGGYSYSTTTGGTNDGIGIHAVRNCRHSTIFTRTCTDRKNKTCRGKGTGQRLQIVKGSRKENGQWNCLSCLFSFSGYLFIFFPTLSCNTLRRLSEGCIPSLRRICVLVLLILPSFLSRMTQMSP